MTGFMSITIDVNVHSWFRAEAKRRGCSGAQVLRDCVSAYKKLVRDSASLPEKQKRYVPVNFS